MIYDVCIIGSGAGGSPIAYELSNAGFNVVVLEKGKYYREEDFNKDELAVSRRELFTPMLKDEKHIIIEHNKNGTSQKYDGYEHSWSFWNGSMVGGSSNLMSGYFHTLKPNDFRLKSVYGDIDGANVVDWPISYEDLKPYYDKAERVVGVSGEGRAYPKLNENAATKWFDRACKELNIESFATPRAIKPFCSYSNFCGSYGCATGAKGSARASLLQKCSAKIITEAFVYELESDEKRVTKAYYYDENKNSFTIEAKIFVLSAQAIESCRLLLNSKNKFFPNGLANNSNQVGKNLIFSAGGSGEGRFDLKDLAQNEQNELMTAGLFFNRSLQDDYEFTKDGKKYKGGTTDFLFEHQNIINRANKEKWSQDNTLLWGVNLQDKIFNAITKSRKLSFEVFNDWLPTDKCFVEVDENTKDKWGINVGVINLFGHERDIEVGEILAQKAVKILEKMGAKDINYSISSSPPSNLVAGGCRFGDDPKTSVLDKNCKSHELENLYVCDASFMPTGGSVPYTWSIYANSFRVADVLLENLKNLSTQKL